MRLGHILHLSGLNRDTYNSLMRRGHIEFMGNRYGDDENRGLTAAHALALVAFRYLRALPLDPAAASLAVGESWGDIVRIVEPGMDAPRSKLCGVRLNDIGLSDTWGWPHPKSKGGDPIAHASVDLLLLWNDLKPAIAKLTDIDGVSEEA